MKSFATIDITYSKALEQKIGTPPDSLKKVVNLDFSFIRFFLCALIGRMKKKQREDVAIYHASEKLMKELDGQKISPKDMFLRTRTYRDSGDKLESESAMSLYEFLCICFG